jgi:hypothetical protein
LTGVPDASTGVPRVTVTFWIDSRV